MQHHYMFPQTRLCGRLPQPGPLTSMIPPSQEHHNLRRDRQKFLASLSPFPVSFHPLGCDLPVVP